MQRFTKGQQLVPFTLHQAGHRDARPPLHNPGNLFLCYPVTEHGGVLALLGIGFLCLQCLFNLGALAILQSGCFFQIIGTFCTFNLLPQIFQLLPQLLNAVDGILFIFPLGFQSVIGIPLLRQFLLQLGKACLGKLVIFLFQCRLLNFHLDNLPGYRIQFRRGRIHFGADLGAGFVHQVDGLIRQEPVGDIAVRKGSRSDDGRVRDLHAMEHFIALFQATQNGDGFLHSRLIYLHRLEPPFQSRVLFNILAVFVQGCGTDAVQLAAGQHRLQKVSCIHAALSLTGSHDGMQLINKQNNLSLGLFHFGKNRLQTLLEFAPVLGTGNQRTHIQGEDRLVLQTLGHILFHDSLSKPLGDGGFTNARLTD